MRDGSLSSNAQRESVPGANPSLLQAQLEQDEHDFYYQQLGRCREAFASQERQRRKSKKKVLWRNQQSIDMRSAGSRSNESLKRDNTAVDSYSDSSSSYSFLGEQFNQCFEDKSEGQFQNSQDDSKQKIAEGDAANEQEYNIQQQFEHFANISKVQKEIVKSVEPIQVSAGFYHTVILANSVERDQFIADLHRLYKTAESTGDVEFVVQNQHKIRAHRIILEARSEVLKNMVSGPMAGSRDYQQNNAIANHQDTQLMTSSLAAEFGKSPATAEQAPKRQLQRAQQISIGSSVSAQSFKLMIEYLYTDDIQHLHWILASRNNSDEEDEGLGIALDLIQLSDEYMLQRLKYVTEEALISLDCISVDNVCHLLNFATLRSAINLRKACFLFIMKNYADVMGSREFLEVLEPAILREVMVCAQRNLKFVFDNYDFHDN